MADARPPTEALLATDSLCRNFGGLAAVRDVSVKLLRGELHAVIGPNGAGKSTLVNLLSGSLRPTSGSIALEGSEVTGEPAWQMAQLGIGRSFQRTNIFRTMTVLENVRLAAQAVGTSADRLLRPAAREGALIEAARAALARAGLESGHERIAGTLSHGEQRQLEIAMTLAVKPKVLLLDEPLAGMGPEEGARFTGLLEALALEHAILLVEHDMDFVFGVADWMTVMVDGAVLAEGKPEAIRSDIKVQRAYLGDHA